MSKKRLISYEEQLHIDLSNILEAEEYVWQAAQTRDKKLFSVALRRVIKAQGVASNSKKA